MNQLIGSPKGSERVHVKLKKTLILIETLETISKVKKTMTVEKRISSLKLRIRKQRTNLTKLSTNARDKVTRYYANIALKEISNKCAHLL